MARYKKLDRDSLLDTAETVILADGAHALTIGSLAKAAGVSRGGIQSCFGSRDQLIEALLDRWNAELDIRLKEVQAAVPEGTDPMQIFLQASKKLHMEEPQRNAAMMILITQSEEKRQWGRKWITENMGSIDTSTAEGRRSRLHFLLWETLLAVKSIQLLTFSENEWSDIFDDLEELLKTD